MLLHYLLLHVTSTAEYEYKESFQNATVASMCVGIDPDVGKDLNDANFKVQSIFFDYIQMHYSNKVRSPY